MMTIHRLWAMAAMTWREAVRRRLAAVGGLVTLAVLALTGAADWRIARLTIGGLPVAPAIRQLLAGQFEILVWFLFSGVLAVGSAFLAASAVAADLESGVALAVLARPLSRPVWLLGKAAGIAALALMYAAVTGAGAYGLAWALAGYRAPHPLWAIGFLAWQATVMMALGLALGSRWAAVTATVVAVTAFFVAWLAGVVHGIAGLVENLWLIRITRAIAVVVPTDGLWRAAMASLESPALLALAARQGVRAAANPFYAVGLPHPAYLLWSAFWVGVVLAWAAAGFLRRDL